MNLGHDNITQTEYRVMRETLGVPVEWVADKIGVQTRSAQRWESNPNTPPIQPAIDLVKTAYEIAATEAENTLYNALAHIDPADMSVPYEQRRVKLWRYYNQSHIDEVLGAGSTDVELENASVRLAYLLLTLKGIAAEVHIAPWGDDD